MPLRSSDMNEKFLIKGISRSLRVVHYLHEDGSWRRSRKTAIRLDRPSFLEFEKIVTTSPREIWDIEVEKA